MAPKSRAAEDYKSLSKELLNRIKIKLKEEFRIEHTTIQVESENYEEIGHVN